MKFPEEIFGQLWEMGLVNAHIPEAYGGIGLHTLEMTGQNIRIASRTALLAPVGIPKNLAAPSSSSACRPARCTG